ncbi:hypothetical protein RJ640_018243 [Escallonia rubra]|uniref:Uncharacterized protein n=1 Tax=Escallonia rubra TaxID=112253 RepID=A0AA88QRX1_9ASTE|nr:hypothetical protein RJ640_018243 [Escallonia rubra]
MTKEKLEALLMDDPLPEDWIARGPELQEPAKYGIDWETCIYEEQVSPTTPNEMASGNGKTLKSGFLGALQKVKGKRKEKMPSVELPPALKRAKVTLLELPPSKVFLLKKIPSFGPDGLSGRATWECRTTMFLSSTFTRESSVVNMVLTSLHILFVIFVIVIGFWRGESKNFTEPADSKHPGAFFPYGAPGVFNGAAMVYLSYIGYDAVSTMAEEVKNPMKDIPIGVSGSVMLVTILYCLMAASMSMLLPYDMFCLGTLLKPFTVAIIVFGTFGPTVSNEYNIITDDYDLIKEFH